MKESQYFVHNIFMAEIANCIINDEVPLNENSEILFSQNARYCAGVKEIIGLYLLIPYLNTHNNQLLYDKKHKQISIYKDDDIAFRDIADNEIKIKDLRDTLCHSFISCDLNLNKKLGDEPVIVFDDRVVVERKFHKMLEHTELGNLCITVKCSVILSFLKKSYEKIFIEYNKG